MLNQYTKWINTNKERLIDEWETGFTTCGDPIDQKTYEDFVAHAWLLECEKQK